MPKYDPPTAARRRARITHDAGPATGAIPPEDLLADDVKILGWSLTDPATKSPPDAGDPDPNDPPRRVSRLSRRSTEPKRGFRLPGKGKRKADAEATVLATARPPAAPASAVLVASTAAPTDVDVNEDGVAPDPPAVGGDRAGRKAPIGGIATAWADVPAPADVPAGLADKADVAPDARVEPQPDRAAATPSSPAKAWLVIIAQLVGGAVAGAALWVAFRYLWGKMPPLALGAAVLATAGSVLLVRAIRRSDDLRTSLFAVLVGLVVTVSPAVLVLVSR